MNANNDTMTLKGPYMLTYGRARNETAAAVIVPFWLE
jgi:hypothetical protein